MASPATRPHGQARPANGRERLLKAALRLSARHRSIASISLRELAREAGLHHTAIYRHFSSIEDVAVCLVQALSRQLREDLHEARRQTAGDTRNMIRATAERYFAYVAEHPQGVMFCGREIHGALPALREALQQMLNDFAADTARDLDALDFSQRLSNPDELSTLARLFAEHNLFAALDYLEYPDQRARILERTVRFGEWLVAGAMCPARDVLAGDPESR